jgi:hypothetical protein
MSKMRLYKFTTLSNEGVSVTSEIVTIFDAFTLCRFCYFSNEDICEWNIRKKKKGDEAPGIWESTNICAANYEMVGVVDIEVRKCCYNAFMLVFDE